MATESGGPHSTVHQPTCPQFFGTVRGNPVRSTGFARLSLRRVSLRRLGRVQGLPSAHVGGASPGRDVGRAGRDARRATVGRGTVRLESHRARSGCPESPHVRGVCGSDSRRPFRDLVLPRRRMRDGPHLQGRASGARESRWPRFVLLHEAGYVARGWESQRNRAAIVGPGKDPDNAGECPRLLNAPPAASAASRAGLAGANRSLHATVAGQGRRIGNAARAPSVPRTVTVPSPPSRG